MPVARDADGAAGNGRNPIHGSKLHAPFDGETGIVRRIALTPASHHERTVAEAIVPGDVGRVWADAAYDAGDLREGLEARSLTPVIAHNPRRGGLRSWQRAANFVVKTVRPKIEPVFGTFMRSDALAGDVLTQSRGRHFPRPDFRAALPPPIRTPAETESA